jgi:hypothetical protein
MKEPVQNFVMRTCKQEDRIKPCETAANKPPTSKASSAVRSTKQYDTFTVVCITDNTEWAVPEAPQTEGLTIA